MKSLCYYNEISNSLMFRSFFYHGSNTNQEQYGGGGGGAIIPFFQKESKNKLNSILVATEAGNHKVGFDDVLYMIKQMASTLGIQGTPDPKKCPYLLLNTMPVTHQHYLIKFTISYQIEESMINSILEDFRTDLSKYVIVLYGKNCADDSVDRKSKQLVKLGFPNVFIYYGGLFEWMLLQDVYGDDLFPTVGKKCELLDFAAKAKFN